MSEVSQAVIDQIQSLLNMTEERGCTENEASNAANLVQKLLLKHNLEMSQVQASGDKGQKADVGHVDISMGRQRSTDYEWCLRLASAVAKACTCRFLWSKHDQALTFVGSATDVKVATELYRFLADQIVILSVKATWGIPDLLPGQPTKTLTAYGVSFLGPKGWNWPTKRGTIDPNYRRSFVVGCTARVAARLEEQVAEARKELDLAGQVTALVAVKDGLINSYVKQTFTFTAGVGPRRTNVSSNRGFHDGYAAGANVNLTKHEKLGPGS